ncbi:hypothetical protein LJB86_00670 [Deltaproteobacteria bacterium OttesenSCG-928-M10]|nr:hypothetical protein [Deltaproteobacteria bacterium OttesenSCG-928-M10]
MMFRKLMIMALAPMLTLAVLAAGAMAMPAAYGASASEQSADIQITPQIRNFIAASAPFLYDANLNSLKLPCIFNRVNAFKRVNVFKRVGAAYTLWDKKIGDLGDQWPEGRNITNPGHAIYMPGGLCNRALLRALIRAP